MMQNRPIKRVLQWCLMIAGLGLVLMAPAAQSADPNKQVTPRQGRATQEKTLQKGKPLQGPQDEGFDRQALDIISDDMRFATKIFTAPDRYRFLDFRKRDPTQITRRGDLILMGASVRLKGLQETDATLTYPMKVVAKGFDADVFPMQADGNLGYRGGGRGGGGSSEDPVVGLWASKVSSFSIDLKNEAEIFNKNIQRSDLDTVLPTNTFAKGHLGGRVFLIIKGPPRVSVTVTGDDAFFKGLRATYEDSKHHRTRPDKIPGFPKRSITERIPSDGILKIAIVPRRRRPKAGNKTQNPRVGFGLETGTVAFSVQAGRQAASKTLGVFEIIGRFERTEIVAGISPFLAKDIEPKQRARALVKLTGNRVGVVRHARDTFSGFGAEVIKNEGGESSLEINRRARSGPTSTEMILTSKTAKERHLTRGWEPIVGLEKITKAKNNGIPVVSAAKISGQILMLSKPDYWYGTSDGSITDAEVLYIQEVSGNYRLVAQEDGNIVLDAAEALVKEAVSAAIGLVLPGGKFSLFLLKRSAGGAAGAVVDWILGLGGGRPAVSIRFAVQGNFADQPKPGVFQFQPSFSGLVAAGRTLDEGQIRGNGVAGDAIAFEKLIKPADPTLLMQISALRGIRGDGPIIVGGDEPSSVHFFVSGMTAATRASEREIRQVLPSVAASVQLVLRPAENVIRALKTR
jgi:hypothetical protein